MMAFRGIGLVTVLTLIIELGDFLVLHTPVS